MFQKKYRFISSRYKFIILAVLIVGIFTKLYYDMKFTEDRLESDIQSLDLKIQAITKDHEYHLYSKYTAIAALYANSKEIQELLKTKNHNELYEKLKKDFIDLQKNDQSLSIVHFFDPKNITILRMHEPEIYGDNLTNIRPMIKLANETKNVLSSFEVGKHGITYRIAIPIITNENEHLGVLEFGIDPYYFSREITQYDKDYKVQFIVKTEHLRVLRKNHNFEKVGDYSIIKKDDIFDNVNSKLDLSKERQIHDLDGKTYLTFNNINFKDTQGNNIAKIVIVKNITDTITKHNQSIVILLTINLIILVAILVLFNSYTKKVAFLQDELEYLNNLLESKVQDQTKELSDSHKMIVAIFETAKDGIAVLDLKSTFTLANSSYVEMIGYSKEELYQRSCVSLTMPNMQKKSKEILQIVLQSGSYKDYEKSCMTKDGRIIDVSMDLTLMADKKHILVITKDITEKKELAKKAKMQEDLLFQQSKMAQMGEMISLIAHQWRQPLAAISANSIDLSLHLDMGTFDLNDMQEIENCKEYFKKSLKETNQYVQNLTTTIDDFRNFYKPNKIYDYVTLDEPIDKALNIIKSSFASSDIEVVENFYCNQKCQIHKNEIMQVILNILKNAQDNFREKNIKNPKIVIECACETPDEVMLSICDNGGGISEDILPKIFDPYFSTKSEQNGTGLGLYMCKTIVEEHHNGEIKVENHKDGVRFMIILKNIHQKM